MRALSGTPEWPQHCWLVRRRVFSDCVSPSELYSLSTRLLTSVYVISVDVTVISSDRSGSNKSPVCHCVVGPASGTRCRAESSGNAFSFIFTLLIYC